MRKGVLATIITFLIVVLFCSIEVKVAAAEQSSGFREESRYVIYTGSTQNALYDSNGSQEGGWAKGAYNSGATLHNLCKFHWELTESEGKYTLTNVGTGASKGIYIFEATADGYKLKAESNSRYLNCDTASGAISFGADANTATIWKLDDIHSRLEGSKHLWKSRTSGQYYRIPAIAVANNGNLIAVSDDRYASNGDLGDKKIDIIVKTSTDNGEVWSAETNLTNGHSTATFGYGDAAIVADRDSDKVLILCATGSSGYGGSTRENPAGVAALVSENNGQSFGAPKDLTEQIYNLKTDWQGLFVASGRIMQSRYIKTDNYYRLYCSVLTRISPGFGSNAIYILYSDDFGENWNILGGGEASPVVAGDEAKLEELPDGSVVVSSRRKSGDGRYINIFTYTQGDPTFTKGSWAAKGEVGLGTAQGTNGEIYTVYAKNAAGEYKYLIMHSVPTARTATDGRTGVGIFYRELSDADTEVSSFISGWGNDKFFMVQDEKSAYSTMTVQKDGNIGFVYEDSGTWYDIVYIGLDLQTITSNQYEMAFEGIGSALTPYQVDTQDKAEAVLDVYINEGVHWEFAAGLVPYLKERLTTKMQQAEACLGGGELVETNPAAIALSQQIQTASGLLEAAGAGGTEVFNCYKDLIQSMEAYEGISQIADELSEKLREAEILYNSASLIPERMEVVELKEAIDALKDESAWKTAAQLNRMLTSLKEKIEAYEQADMNSFTVEARYSSNHIRINALKGVTAYNIYKSLTEDGEYQKLTTVNAEEGKNSYSYIDTAAETHTRVWYSVEAVKPNAAENIDLGRVRDDFATGIEAVQQHAQEQQYHKDFISEDDTTFNGSRIDEASAEELAKVAGLKEGTLFLSYQPQAASSGRKVIFTVKQQAASVGDSNLGAGTGFVLYQVGTNVRIDASHGLKGNLSGVAPVGNWSTFGYVNTLYTGNSDNAVISRNGTTSQKYNQNDMNGFIGVNTNLGTMSTGAANNNGTPALHFTGDIAYATITDEVFSEQELNAYTQALNAALEAGTPVPPAVQNLQAVVAEGDIVLSWSALSGGATGYKVSKDGGQTWEAADSSSGHRVTGLTEGETYTLEVCAVNLFQKGETASITITLEEENPSEVPVVEAPVFQPAGGTYEEAQKVTITSATEGVTIYYTTDGTMPTTHSNEYTEAITVDQSRVIQALAVKNGEQYSSITEAVYVIQSQSGGQEKAEAPVFSLRAGTYTAAKEVEITTDTPGATIYYTLDGTVPTTESAVYKKAILVDQTRIIKAIAVKEGMETSEVASIAYIIKLPVDIKQKVETPVFSLKAGTYTEVQSVEITSATEGAEIYYTLDGSTPTTNSTKYDQEISVEKTMTIKAIAVKSGMENSKKAEAAYVIIIDQPSEIKQTTVQTPAFSVAGGRYPEAKSVEITCDTPGAEIYYTVDGEMPTENSTKYSKAITVNKTMIIKAIAIKKDMENSKVAVAAYTIQSQSPEPQSPKPAPSEKPWIFTDVEQNGSWKHQGVKYVYNRDVMGEITGTTLFQPDRPLSRSMFATVLYRMAGEPKVKYNAQFPDVPADKWYSNAIIWAYQRKIVSGMGDGTFGIDRNITREQIAKMLYEYAKGRGYNVSAKKDLNSFTDVKSVSNWAVDYMKWATAVEMITGKPNDAANTSFRMDPQGEATRAECAAMLMRFANKYIK